MHNLKFNIKKGNIFTDSIIVEINISYLESWGFRRINNRWYYKDNYVEMGDLLPLSDDLVFLEPLTGKELHIKGKVTCKINESNSEGFTEKGELLNNEFYKLEITCPTYNVLPDSVKSRF